VTVRELLELLQQAQPEDEVRVAYDSDCAYGDAEKVEICLGHIYISTTADRDEGPE